MKFAYTLIYVPDVQKAVDFYQQAFSFQCGFQDPEYQYAELVTGETKLGFVAESLAEGNLPDGFIRGDLAGKPANMEIAFTDNDITAAFAQAVRAGATPVANPVEKPWGQTIAYVRDPFGTLIELATPMGEAS